ncbi:Cytochrome P450 1A1 [Mactra antiquata]
MMMVTGFIIASLILVIVFVYMNRKKSNEQGKAIPHYSGWPVIGMALDINVSNSIYKFDEMVKRSGHIFSVNMCGKTMVVLNSADLLRKAFSSEQYAKYFNDRPKSSYPRFFRPSGDSLGYTLQASDPMFKLQKKTMIRAIHAYGSGIQKLEDKVLAEMENVLNKIENMETKEFDCSAFLQRSLSNIISLILVGKMIPDGDPDENLPWQKTDATDYFASPIIDTILTALPSLRLLPFTTLGNKYRESLEITRRIADKFFYSIEKKDYGDDDDGGIVQFYLEEQRKEKMVGGDTVFTDERIVSQILETIEAGVITTWSALTNSMLILVNHPECQLKLQKEFDEVIGDGRWPRISDRSQCHYFMAYEKEVHRYTPLAPTLIPHVCNDNVLLEGYNVQKDSVIIGNLWYIHHDEKVWGDPWNFRPERFLDDNGHILPPEHPYCRSIFPFGIGDRKCVGETFAKSRYFLYIATFMQHYNFEFPEGAKKPSCDPRNVKDFDCKLTLRAKPFIVHAIKRKLK